MNRLILNEKAGIKEKLYKIKIRKSVYDLGQQELKSKYVKLNLSISYQYNCLNYFKIKIRGIDLSKPLAIVNKKNS